MTQKRIQELQSITARLSQLDVSKLSESQLAERNTLIKNIKEELTKIKEVSDTTLVNYLTKVDADSRKHPADPTKRSPEKASKSVAGFSRAFNKLDARPEQKDVEESLADDFMKMAQARGYNVRRAGTPDEERARTQQMLAQRAKERQEQEQQAALADVEKLPELKAKFEEMKKLYQSLGGSNWQYADREQNLTDNERKARSMEPELNRLAAQISRAEKAQGVTEDIHGEYSDEAGMAKSNLHTMSRAVNGLMDTIQDNDNLPEWAQEKLAKAEMMVTSVWDYLLSQKEQGIDPKVGESMIGSKLPQSDTETFGLEKGRAYKISNPKDWKPGDRPRAVQQLIPTQDKKDHIRSRLGKHKAPVLPEQDVAEGMEDSPVASAITRRIMMQRVDLLSKYGPEKVLNAIEDVADFVGDVEEIGSSDVSGWVKQVERTLGDSTGVTTEAYDRLKKVFDFSNFKG